jgi:hypothetical protein
MRIPRDLWLDFLIIFGPTAVLCLIIGAIAFLVYVEVLKILW